MSKNAIGEPLTAEQRRQLIEFKQDRKADFEEEFGYPKRRTYPVRTCTLMVWRDGEGKPCAGEIKVEEVYEPFTNHTPIGPGHHARLIGLYGVCSNCHVRFEFSEEDEEDDKT